MKVIALLREGELTLVEVKPDANVFEVPVWSHKSAAVAPPDAPVRLDTVFYRPSGALDPRRREVWTEDGVMPPSDVALALKLLRTTPVCMASVCTASNEVAKARPKLIERFQHMLGTTEVQLLSVTTVSILRQTGRAAPVSTDLVSHRATARGVLPWMVTP